MWRIDLMMVIVVMQHIPRVFDHRIFACLCYGSLSFTSVFLTSWRDHDLDAFTSIRMLVRGRLRDWYWDIDCIHCTRYSGSEGLWHVKMHWSFRWCGSKHQSTCRCSYLLDDVDHRKRNFRWRSYNMDLSADLGILYKYDYTGQFNDPGGTRPHDGVSILFRSTLNCYMLPEDVDHA